MLSKTVVSEASHSNNSNSSLPPPPARSSLSSSSSRTRPCDTCRLRKTRCVREANQGRCVLCTFHNQPCTFLRGPVPRQRRAAAAAAARDGENAPAVQQHHHQPPSPAAGGGGGVVSSPGSTVESSQSQSPLQSVERPAILNNTLGLDLETHAEYIGPTDYRDPVLLDLHRPEQLPSPSSTGITNNNGVTAATRHPRRLDDRTIFLVHPDESAASEAQRIADLDAIEATVHPLGRTLVDLYFRIVHPSFPILHKAVFISKHRASHRHFAPSLLAAVYLLALDWQIYDSRLAGRESGSIPDAAALEALAERTVSQDMRRPKLSTLEAGLLLLQRSRKIGEHGSSSNMNTTSSRTFTAQMVAMAQDLGIHVDCSEWSIPHWEVGLRRRLAWALYMQDRWGAFSHGRPFLIHDCDWDVRPCTDADYPELTDDEEGETAQIGWELFLQHVALAHILSDIMRTFYTAAATRSGGTLDRMGVVAAVELAKPFVLRLREWHASLPSHCGLHHLQNNSNSGQTIIPNSNKHKLSANGGLHLAHAATEIALHRALLRIMTPTTPGPLYAVVRSTARAKLQSATELLAGLGPEHTAAFWSSAAAYQAAEVGSLAGLLWATADSPDEMAWCAARADELRWALRVRGAAAPFAREALRLLERDIGGLGMVM